MQTTFIITFIGDDRPGLVEALAAVIAKHEGNWLESRLSQLAGKFAGLIQVTLPSDQDVALQAALKALDERGLSVRVTAAAALSAPQTTPRLLKLSVLAPDRPGIVREISAALSQRDINVIELHSQVSSAPMSAEPLFEALIEADVAAGTDLDELEERLDAIADQMDLEINLEQG